MRIANNLIYDNDTAGLRLSNLSGEGIVQVINNTIYQTASDALELRGTTRNVRLKNNILWAAGADHHALYVDNSAQDDFASDYNLFHYTDGAHLGFWQRPIDSLADWAFELGFDSHSISGDPRFVDPEGEDGILGFRTESPRSGADDNFTLASTSGSYHFGVPARDPVNSPAIDAGDPADVVTESDDLWLSLGTTFNHQHGGRVDLGASGNTPLASRTAADGIQVLFPNGREHLVSGRSTTATWRSFGPRLSGQVKIELSTDGGATWVVMADRATDNGRFTFEPTNVSLNALIRVSDAISPAISDIADNAFVIGAATNTFYVNDTFDPSADQYARGGLQRQQWDHAPRSDGHAGRTHSTPSRSRPGDTILVDAGEYDAIATIRIDEPVTILGPTNGRIAVINRGNATASQAVIEASVDVDISLGYLHLTGGGIGLRGVFSEVVRQLQLNQITASENETGFVFEATADRPVVHAVNAASHTNKLGLSLSNVSLASPGPGGGGAESIALFRNATGAVLTSSSLAGARIFGNTAVGVTVAGDSSAVLGNTIYSNPVGIDLPAATGTVRILNNVVYSHDEAALRVGSAPSALATLLVENNTFHEPRAAGVRLAAATNDRPMIVKHNIFSVQGSAALDVGPGAHTGLRSEYNLFHVTAAGSAGRMEGLPQATYRDWALNTGHDRHSLDANPRFVSPAGPDGRLGYDPVAVIDYGRDDNFRLAALSPAIDGGDPGVPVLHELAPHGDRVDIGATGNTALANLSPPQLVQLLSPSALDKLEQDTTVSIRWRSSGARTDHCCGKLS